MIERRCLSRGFGVVNVGAEVLETGCWSGDVGVVVMECLS
jgi:hypothetical protein